MDFRGIVEKHRCLNPEKELETLTESPGLRDRRSGCSQIPKWKQLCELDISHRLTLRLEKCSGLSEGPDTLWWNYG